MARISSQSLAPIHLEIEFREETVHLPVWTDKKGTVFVSTLDLLRYLRTDPAPYSNARATSMLNIRSRKDFTELIVG